ncbi:hypothetical protein [Kutzneria sp. NPDC052558]|uniref:hypothetical protein n=1 Tax=Kutzneria sp. NPDC052558 TaxID=3364121 RepID=UPI0037CA2BC1
MGVGVGVPVGQPPTGPAVIVRAVTVITATVVGLTFLFGFGNVLALALRLGVSLWVAPLVAPAVDLSILGLLLGIRYLALSGASGEALRSPRKLLIFASAVTLALNVADPVIAGDFGLAAFDSVGPLLLIGWAEVGPEFLRSLSVIGQLRSFERCDEVGRQGFRAGELVDQGVDANDVARSGQESLVPTVRASGGRSEGELLDSARRLDAKHRAVHQRPISADVLRGQLGIGAAQARRLVKTVRSEFAEQCGCRCPT